MFHKQRCDVNPYPRLTALFHGAVSANSGGTWTLNSFFYGHVRFTEQELSHAEKELKELGLDENVLYLLGGHADDGIEMSYQGDPLLAWKLLDRLY